MRFLYIPVLYVSLIFYITLIGRPKAIYYVHKTHRYYKMLAKLCKTAHRHVRNLGRGFLHHPILWSRKRLWDGSITTLTWTDTAYLSCDVIRTVCVFMIIGTCPNWLLLFAPNSFLSFSPTFCCCLTHGEYLVHTLSKYLINSLPTKSYHGRHVSVQSRHVSVQTVIQKGPKGCYPLFSDMTLWLIARFTLPNFFDKKLQYRFRYKVRRINAFDWLSKDDCRTENQKTASPSPHES